MTKQTTATPAQLQAHARELAAAFQIRLIESDQLAPHEAFAVPHLRAIVAATIREETTYAVVLHEAGHLAAPSGVLPGMQRTSGVLCEEERAAWAWARHYALIWTDVMEHVATYAEGTYQPPAPAPAAAPTPSRIDWKRYR